MRKAVAVILIVLMIFGIFPTSFVYHKVYGATISDPKDINPPAGAKLTVGNSTAWYSAGFWKVYVDGKLVGEDLCIVDDLKLSQTGNLWNMLHKNTINAWLDAFTPAPSPTGYYSGATFSKKLGSYDPYYIKTITYGGKTSQRLHIREAGKLAGVASITYDENKKEVYVQTTQFPTGGISFPSGVKEGDKINFQIRGTAYANIQAKTVTYEFYIDGKMAASNTLSKTTFNETVTKTLTAGTHSLVLKVTDGVGRTTTYTKSITVQPGSPPPPPPGSIQAGIRLDLDPSSLKKGTTGNVSATVDASSSSSSGSGPYSARFWLKVNDKDVLDPNGVAVTGLSSLSQAKYTKLISNARPGDRVWAKVRVWDASINKTAEAETTKIIGQYENTPPPPEEEPTPPPAPEPEPPVAGINAPSEVIQGEDVRISSSSYDPDGTIEDYDWRITPSSGVVGTLTGKSGRIYFDNVGTYTVKLTVTDNDGLTDTAQKTIEVKPALPKAYFDYSGALKENRKVILDASGSSTIERYPIIWEATEWEITPVSAGLTQNDIKIVSSSDMKTRTVLFKKAGDYRVRVRVKNSAGHYSEYERVLTIYPDLPPIADFYVYKTVLRNPDDENYASIQLFDISYSSDGDTINSRIWRYKYDSDNDGSFDDESWVVLDDGNNLSPTLKTKNVGKYLFELNVREGFGEETIPEFISPSDYRADDTSDKLLNDKICEVINLQPVVDFEVKVKKNVDILVFKGSYLDSYNTESYLNSILIPQLTALNVDYKILTINPVETYIKWENNISYSSSFWGDYWGQGPGNYADGGYITGNGSYYFARNRYINIGYNLKKADITKLKFYAVTGGGDTSLKPIDFYVSSDGRAWYKVGTAYGNNGSQPAIFEIQSSSLPIDNIKYFRGSNESCIDLLHVYAYSNTSDIVRFIEGYSFNQNKINIVINIDSIYINYKDDLQKANFLSKLATNNAAFIGIGSSATYSSYSEIVNTTGKGICVLDKSLSESFSIAKDYIRSLIEQENRLIEQYILLGEEVTYNTYYSDTESDPKYQERWIYEHDPNYFENSLGLAPFSGQYISGPVTVFDKVGKYEVQFQARDNPKADNRFDNYRLWSYMPLNKLVLYVHRKPVASFTANLTPVGTASQTIIEDFEDTNYEFSFSGNWGRSTAQRYAGQYSYKSASISHSSTTSTQFTFTIPSGATNAKISFYYFVRSEPNYDFFNFYINGNRLIHDSGYGSWKYFSYPLSPGTYTFKFEYTKDGSVSSYDDAAYIDNLTVQYDGAITSYSVQLTSTSYDLDHQSEPDKGIVEEEWKWKETTATSWNSGKPSTLGVNKTYLVWLRVKDKEGAWSDPYVSVLSTMQVNLAPIAMFTVDPNTQVVNKTISISDMSYDPNGDPIAERSWRVQKPDGTWVNYGSTPPTNIPSLGVGTYTIELKVRDNPKFGTPLWSEPYTQQVTVIHENNKPVARFTIGPNPIVADEPYTLNDTSYDPDGDPIVAREWKVQKPDGTWVTISQWKPTFEEMGLGDDGTYKIQLRILDDPSRRHPALTPMWSDPYVVTVQVQGRLIVIGSSNKNTYKAGEAMILYARTEGKAYRVEARMWYPKNEFSSSNVTTLVPDTPLTSPPQDVMTWHTKHTKAEGRDVVVIIPKDMPDGNYQVVFTAYKQLAGGGTKTATDTITVRVKGTIYDHSKSQIIGPRF